MDSQTPNFQTIAEIKDANARAGLYFFERDTMGFFSSRVEGQQVFGGRYFITSEQFRPSSGPASPRKYTIREARATGDVRTAGKFQAFGSSAEARAVARQLVAIRAQGKTPILGQMDCPSCAVKLPDGAMSCPSCGVESFTPAPEGVA